MKTITINGKEVTAAQVRKSVEHVCDLKDFKKKLKGMSKGHLNEYVKALREEVIERGIYTPKTK